MAERAITRVQGAALMRWGTLVVIFAFVVPFLVAGASYAFNLGAIASPFALSMLVVALFVVGVTLVATGFILRGRAAGTLTEEEFDAGDRDAP